MLLFLAGVALRSFISFNNFYLLAAFGIAAIFCFGWLNRRAAIIGLSLVFAFLFGVFWFGMFELKEFKLERFVSARARLEGRIIGEPSFSGSSQKLIFTPDAAPREKILIFAKRYPEFEYGDKVVISGDLENPQNNGRFNYRNYLLKDGIYFTASYPEIELLDKNHGGVLHNLISFKRRFERNINDSLSLPHSAFVNGILLGDRSEFPADLKQMFISSGVSHLVALSGYNVSVIVLFISFIFGYLFFSRKTLAFWATVALVFLFVLTTGASASLVRAAVMGTSVLVARYFGRGTQAGRLLIFAAFVMVLINPKILVYDVGFQLSFLAMLGLIYISPLLVRKLKRIPEFWKFKGSFIETLSAQAAVLPLLIFSFGQFSIVSPLTNTLILPFVPYTMLFGFVVGVAGFLSGALSQIFAFPLWTITSCQLWIINFFANFSFSSLYFNI